MVRETVEITGTAMDKNGIDFVEVSVDNGNTYNRARGTENWKYTLDTRIIDDGTHVIFVRAHDKYGQTLTVSELLNIDNIPPTLKFESPVSGSKHDNILYVAGTMYDTVDLDNVLIKIKGLSGQSIPASLREMKLKNDRLVRERLDISGLSEGRYNIEILAYDRAGNETVISRNFDIERAETKNKVELMYPLDGEYITGGFNIYGKINHTSYPKSVSLYVDGNEFATADVTLTGFFNFKIAENELPEGVHQLAIKAAVIGDRLDTSNMHEIRYSEAGPWITMDNFAMGDFVVDRPYIRGRLGYSFSEKEKELIANKQGDKDALRFVDEKKVKSVEISFNNGKDFKPVKWSSSKWKYRLETEYLEEGNHFLLVRATMGDDKVAVCRTVVKVDKTVPTITLINPKEGGVYNDSITFSGLATDNVMLKKVEMSLRQGDKYFYSVPKALQGLHFEVGVIGATLWNVGAGLSFFDNKVKLQFHYGQMLDSQWNSLKDSKKNIHLQGLGSQYKRYGGNVFTAKILASVYELPFKRFAGPNLRWLYLTAAVGANFSVFTDTQSGNTQVLSAMLVQIEFPQVRLQKKKVKYFNTFSIYTEGSLWFIPTDVAGLNPLRSVIPRIAFGIRANVF